MYYRYSEEELRAICRTSLETFEIWARRLIHEKMVEKYGETYIDKRFQDGNYLVRREVREHVHKMKEKEPERFKRAVDTLFMEHIIYFLCNPDFFKNVFECALRYSYPQGREEAREFMERLVDIRNALSHSNPISMRQAEKAICYSNDFIDGIKKYQEERGQDKVWNVPRIIKVTDSLGNVFENPIDGNGVGAIFMVSQNLYCGDTYSINIEIDASFDEAEYDVKWLHNEQELQENRNRKQYVIKFSEKDVSENYFITCRTISNKVWHKYELFDCQISLCLKVYPLKE